MYLNREKCHLSLEKSFSTIRPVLPSVQPGYLHSLLPTEMPVGSENWKDIMKDLDQLIMPGVTHWQSPNFHAYYPSQSSFPSIIGEMLSAGLGVIGFSWVSRDLCLLNSY